MANGAPGDLLVVSGEHLHLVGVRTYAMVGGVADPAKVAATSRELAVLVRYADVTAPALYGRPVNLFWDMRHVSAVAAMLARVASWRLVLLIIAATILIPFVLYRVIRWALGRVSEAMSRRIERQVLAAAAVVVIVLFSWADAVPW